MHFCCVLCVLNLIEALMRYFESCWWPFSCSEGILWVSIKCKLIEAPSLIKLWSWAISVPFKRVALSSSNATKSFQFNGWTSLTSLRKGQVAFPLQSPLTTYKCCDAGGVIENPILPWDAAVGLWSASNQSRHCAIRLFLLLGKAFLL